jgi:hypothetical protein
MMDFERTLPSRLSPRRTPFHPSPLAVDELDLSHRPHLALMHLDRLPLAKIYEPTVQIELTVFVGSGQPS